MSNREEIIKPQGWKLVYILNTDYPKKSLDEYIQVAQYWNEEFIEIWYWLIYQGKDPRGYAPPIEKKIKVHHYPTITYMTSWEPQPNSWREANDKEMDEILVYINSGKYHILKETHTKVKTYSTLEEEKLSTGIIIPISYIFKLPNGLIVKKWRSNEDQEEIELW